nr:hypothetical protein [Candidatus Gracilibacteria bacterium]
MQFLISKKLFLSALIVFCTSYTVFVSYNKSGLENYELTHPTIGKINSILRGFYENITGKGEEISTNSKNLYDKNIAPNVDNIKNGVEDGINTTKERVDNVRLALSGAEDTINKTKEVIDKGTETINQATEVFNDMNKMGNVIMNSVNTGAIK